VAFRHPSEKYEFVSWDDDIPNMWKVVKFMFQTTNQNISKQKYNYAFPEVDNNSQGK